MASKPISQSIIQPIPHLRSDGGQYSEVERIEDASVRAKVSGCGNVKVMVYQPKGSATHLVDCFHQIAALPLLCNQRPRARRNLPLASPLEMALCLTKTLSIIKRNKPFKIYCI